MDLGEYLMGEGVREWASRIRRGEEAQTAEEKHLSTALSPMGGTPAYTCTATPWVGARGDTWRVSARADTSSVQMSVDASAWYRGTEHTNAASRPSHTRS